MESAPSVVLIQPSRPSAGAQGNVNDGNTKQQDTLECGLAEHVRVH